MPLAATHAIPEEVQSAGLAAKVSLHIASTGGFSLLARADMARMLAPSKRHQWVAIEHVVGHNIVDLQVVDCWPITQVVDEFQFEHLEPEQSGIGWKRAVGNRPEDVGVDKADVKPARQVGQCRPCDGCTNCHTMLSPASFIAIMWTSHLSRHLQSMMSSSLFHLADSSCCRWTPASIPRNSCLVERVVPHRYVSACKRSTAKWMDMKKLSA